jgi:hypothetical protein
VASGLKPATIIWTLLVVVLLLFLAWRFLRPLNIFVVTAAFERPVNTQNIAAPLESLHAEECGACHPDFYAEWRTSIHSQAWTDPYFQADWTFEDSQQICRNCHTPLDRQQPQRVTDYRDKEKWDPVLVPNPAFDETLQHQGVTCAACHLRDGEIVGVLGDTDAPHPVEVIADPNQVCLRCHVVEGDRWDTFFRFPPCGTVAEIKQTAGVSGEVTVPDVNSLACVQCHMPSAQRSLVEVGSIRMVRQHLWRGGHDPEMVKKAFEAVLTPVVSDDATDQRFKFTITNTGAAHYLPTGTPDRHLVIELRLLDKAGHVVKTKQHVLKRTVMWRPFIVDLWDTRLPRWQPRSFYIDSSVAGADQPTAVEAVVWYHLVAESRRRRIGYDNMEPTAFKVFEKRIVLQPPGDGGQV